MEFLVERRITCIHFFSVTSPTTLSSPLFITFSASRWVRVLWASSCVREVLVSNGQTQHYVLNCCDSRQCRSLLGPDRISPFSPQILRFLSTQAKHQFTARKRWTHKMLNICMKACKWSEPIMMDLLLEMISFSIAGSHPGNDFLTDNYWWRDWLRVLLKLESPDWIVSLVIWIGDTRLLTFLDRKQFFYYRLGNSTWNTRLTLLQGRNFRRPLSDSHGFIHFSHPFSHARPSKGTNVMVRVHRWFAGVKTQVRRNNAEKQKSTENTKNMKDHSQPPPAERLQKPN